MLAQFDSGQSTPSQPSLLGAGAVTAAEDFEIDVVAGLAEVAEADRCRRIEAFRDDVAGGDLRQRLHDGIEDPVGRQKAGPNRCRRFRIEDRAERRIDGDHTLDAVVERNVGIGQNGFTQAIAEATVEATGCS